MSAGKDIRAHIGYDAAPTPVTESVVAHPLRHLTAWARARVLGT